MSNANSAMRSSWSGWESIAQQAQGRSRTPSFDHDGEESSGILSGAASPMAVADTHNHHDHADHMAACERCGTVHTCHTPPVNNNKVGPRWRKILYERQPFEDNYVDESFLSSMVTNANLQVTNFGSLAFDTLVISQQVSIVIMFLVVFFNFFYGLMTVRFLITIDASLIILGFGLRVLLEEEIDLQIDKLRQFANHIAANIKRLFLFVSILLALSPVLKTLTSSFSSNTIYALTIIFCALHLFFYDYSYVNTPQSTTK
jgi:hypothetical protein